jgi:hypothetical protein
MPLPRIFCALAVAWLALPLLAGGCGHSSNLPPRAKVTGHVTLDGKPLTTGFVTFVPDAKQHTDGPPAVGGINLEGLYELSTDRQSTGDGAIVGFHRVRVMAYTPSSDPQQSMTASLIPLRYNNEATSGLAFEVKAGKENVCDLALVADKPAGKPNRP